MISDRSIWIFYFFKNNILQKKYDRRLSEILYDVDDKHDEDDGDDDDDDDDHTSLLLLWHGLLARILVRHGFLNCWVGVVRIYLGSPKVEQFPEIWERIFSRTKNSIPYVIFPKQSNPVQ